MLGAIAGDIIGSVHEWAGTTTKAFPLFCTASTFTDESLLTIAVADSLLHDLDPVDTFHDYFHRYPGAGFGGSFVHWAFRRRRTPYHSFGNGAAVRVSPIAYAFGTLEEVIVAARANARVTHGHTEAIEGAALVAAMVYAARTGASRQELHGLAERRFGTDLSQSLAEIRPGHRFDSSCRGSIPPSLLAFFESVDFEDAIRNAVSLGGDADSMASMTGAIAEAFYGGVPESIRAESCSRLDAPLRAVVDEFEARYLPDAGPAPD